MIAADLRLKGLIGGRVNAHPIHQVAECVVGLGRGLGAVLGASQVPDQVPELADPLGRGQLHQPGSRTSQW